MEPASNWQAMRDSTCLEMHGFSGLGVIRESTFHYKMLLKQLKDPRNPSKMDKHSESEC